MLFNMPQKISGARDEMDKKVIYSISYGEYVAKYGNLCSRASFLWVCVHPWCETEEYVVGEALGFIMHF